MREAAIVGRVGRGSIRGLEDQIAKWIYASPDGIHQGQIERLVGRKFSQPFKPSEVRDATARVIDRIGAVTRHGLISPLTEAKNSHERRPSLDGMHSELAQSGLKPNTTAGADGPDFSFDTEEEAKKAAEILMNAGYAIRSNNRQGTKYRVAATWAKDLSEKPDQEESVRGTVLGILRG